MYVDSNFRTTDNYANFLKSLGWQISNIYDKKNKQNIRVFLWKIPFINKKFGQIQKSPTNIDLDLIGTFCTDQSVLFLLISFNISASSIEATRLSKLLSKFFFLPVGWCNSPTKTTIISLNQSIEKIFNTFKSKTRYNIRLSKKKDVKVVTIKGSEFAKFSNLLGNFVKILDKKNSNKKLSKFSFQYLKKLAFFFKDDLLIFVATKNEEVVAGAIFLGDKKTFSYTQNASNTVGKQFFAPSLLVYTAIKYAKNKNYSFFDFEGIEDYRVLETKSWKGFTRFKRNFSNCSNDTEYMLPYKKVFSSKSSKLELMIGQFYCRKFIFPFIYPSEYYF